MKIKVYWIQSGKPVKDYILTIDPKYVTINHMVDILKQAKRRFKMPGKQYIILAGDNVFYASRVGKEWSVYQLLGAENEQVV